MSVISFLQRLILVMSGLALFAHLDLPSTVIGIMAIIAAMLPQMR